MSHVIKKSKTITLNSMYVNKIYNNTQMIKLVFCWISKEITIALVCIVALLIIGNLYFSIFKCYFFLKNIKNTILEQDNEKNKINNRQIKGINNIQGILFLYPLIACAIWIIFFLFIFLFYFNYREHTSKIWTTFFCIFMTIRQIIYTLVYFLSQKKLRNYTVLFLKCKTCKKEKNLQEKIQIEMTLKSKNDNIPNIDAINNIKA